MQNVKSYFSSWKPFWKSSSNNNCQSRTLTLAPSNIHFTSSSLGDLKNSVIDEKLMIDISTKLMESDCPPKLQIFGQNNQWFALNNSHLLVYRQLERIGLCDTVGKYSRWKTEMKIIAKCLSVMSVSLFPCLISLWHNTQSRRTDRHSTDAEHKHNIDPTISSMLSRLSRTSWRSLHVDGWRRSDFILLNIN